VPREPAGKAATEKRAAFAWARAGSNADTSSSRIAWARELCAFAQYRAATWASLVVLDDPARQVPGWLGLRAGWTRCSGGGAHVLSGYDRTDLWPVH
jgi:hypothetical protein